MNRSRPTMTLIFFLLAGIAFSAYWYRCSFGMDFTDEAFYLLPAFKLFALGDLPFVDEVINGARQADLLNGVFVNPWAPFSVLFLRRAAVIVYGVILLFFTRVAFRSFSFLALLNFLAFFLYDYFLMPTWSYNWWARNGCFITEISITGLRSSSSRFPRTRGAEI